MIFSSCFLIQLWYLLVSALKWCLYRRHQQKRFCKGVLLHVLTGSVRNVLWEGGYFLREVVGLTSASSLAGGGGTPQWMFLEGFVVLYSMYFLFYQDIWIRTYLLTVFVLFSSSLNDCVFFLQNLRKNLNFKHMFLE